MNIKTQDEKNRLLVFERGEEVISGLQDFCRSEDIASGWVQAIGSAEQLGLGYYDLAGQSYITGSPEGIWEILSCKGNISLKEDGSVFAHLHGVFGDSEMRTVGGHIFNMTTAVTCELLVTVLPGPIRRSQRHDIGLELL